MKKELEDLVKKVSKYKADHLQAMQLVGDPKYDVFINGNLINSGLCYTIQNDHTLSDYQYITLCWLIRTNLNGSTWYRDVSAFASELDFHAARVELCDLIIKDLKTKNH